MCKVVRATSVIRSIESDEENEVGANLQTFFATRGELVALASMVLAQIFAPRNSYNSY